MHRSAVVAFPPPVNSARSAPCSLATVPAAAHPAGAITCIMPSDGSMVDWTGTIVSGRVLFAAAAPDGLPLPATDFTVTVEEVLKGAVAGSTIVVRQPGGARSDGLAMRIAGLPMLQEGERVLLFLTGQRSGESGALRFRPRRRVRLGHLLRGPGGGRRTWRRRPFPPPEAGRRHRLFPGSSLARTGAPRTQSPPAVSCPPTGRT